MIIENQVCPICDSKLTKENVARKYWLESKPLRLDYAGRVVCQECMHWIENTDWD